MYLANETPISTLKERQRYSLDQISFEMKPSPFSYSDTHYKNLALCASVHVGKNAVGTFVISNLLACIKPVDLNDALMECGYRQLTADEMAIHFYDFNDGLGMRLPAGGLASRFLANMRLKFFDWSMAWVSERLGCDYSRHGATLIVSGQSRRAIKSLEKYATKSLAKLWLALDPRKTQIMGRNQSQIVCGLLVNSKLNMPRLWREQLRAEICSQKGLDLRPETKGKIAMLKAIQNLEKTTMPSSALIREIKERKSIRCSSVNDMELSIARQ